MAQNILLVNSMRTIIAGSRTITDYELVTEAIHNSGFSITEVICGGAKGVDELGAKWAENNNATIVYVRARWDVFGKSAGYKRNEAMAHLADAAIVIHNNSPGSLHMIVIAKKFGLIVFEKVVL